MTASERYVSELCRQSFLPFWSFPNPIGKKNKELCDVLVVCGPYIIIISVKDITVSDHPVEEVQYDRWVKKAIENSVDQIYGAERFLLTASEVLLNDRITKIKLPDVASRQVFRIAVAFGSKPNFPLPMGDFGNGFVSVFDEQSAFVMLNELDTISDFTSYLKAKENFFSRKTIVVPSEADFLAVYLQSGLVMPAETDLFVCDIGTWNAYARSEEYSIWRKDIQKSFIWDRMITSLHQFHIMPGTTSERRTQMEEAVRYINLEPRMNRIVLSEVLNKAKSLNVAGRILRPLEGANHAYVFIPLTSRNWERKEDELKHRCLIARMENPQTQNIIGISIGDNGQGESCFDICFVHIPELNDEFVARAAEIQNEFGYFKNKVISTSEQYRNQ